MNSMLSFILLISITTFAKEKNEHRQHQAHVHGAATLNIAFDQVSGKIEFKSAADSVLGFEHAVKSDKDKKILSEAILKFETGISQMIQFDSVLGCVITKEKIEMIQDGSHADFRAHFNVTCLKAITGTNIIFDFTGLNKIKDLDVTVLADALQKTIEVKTKPVTLELK